MVYARQVAKKSTIMLLLNNMFLKKHFILNFVCFLFVFIFFIFNNKLSFAADCNASGGLCIPKNDPKYSEGCPRMDPTLTGCAENGICCLGGPTCLSKKGKCVTPDSCTNGTIDYFRCEGGPNNVCCIESGVTQASPSNPIIDTLNQQKEERQQIGLAGWKAQATLADVSLFVSAITGDIPLNTSSNTAYLPGGILGTLNHSIAYLYSSPAASGIEYLAQMKDNFLNKPVYAQGTGFTGLQPILPIWRGFRNLIYILFSLVFIVIGIMIMLRVKISPQAVITLESAIPKIITTLILVTFSYAIAGLLIDLSYVIQNLCIAILFQTQANGIGGTLLDRSFSEYANGGFGMIIGLMWRALPIGSSIANLGSLLLSVIGGFIGGFGLIGPGGGGAVLIAGAIGLLILFLVILILLVVWLFKFFFGLARCYVMIIFKIIIAPLEIGLGSFPNVKIGFSSWIISLIAYISVFPASYLFIIFVNIVVEKVSKASLWVPNILSSNPTTSSIAFGSFVKPAYALDQTTFTFGIYSLLGMIFALVGTAFLSKIPDILPKILGNMKPNKDLEIGGSFASGLGVGKLIGQSSGASFAQRLIERGTERTVNNTTVTPTGIQKFGKTIGEVIMPYFKGKK